jgi:clan AA aspartic protease (TIGR02281 family)
MRLIRGWKWELLAPLVCIAFQIVGSASAQADELADAKAALTKAGLRPTATGVVMPAEAELSKELARSVSLRKQLTQALKAQQAVEQQRLQGQQTLTALRQQHVALNAQLVGVTDVSTNNRIVGALEAMRGQHELVEEQLKQLETTLKEARGKANDAREAYVDYVLNTRKLVDRIELDYETKASDPEAKAALDLLNKAFGKSLAITPSAGFTSNVKKLKALEDTVLSESIPLRVEGANTFMVSTVINGKHTQEMVLDSGASMISLPAAMATKFGLEPGSKDPKILLTLADGRVIEGYKMTLKSVRVGKFIVENVDCAVLGADAIRAEPLLGMSFLGQFKFEVDAAASSLTMVKVSGAETGGRSGK